jgi:sugar phosphate isomerase/epimerase
MNRRRALEALSVSSLAGALPLTGVVRGAIAGAPPNAGAAPLPLGFDNFAVRAFKWKAPALIDYAARLRCDSLLISDLDAFESLETRALVDVRKRAADAGVGLHLGTWSVCPTSNTFKKTWGTAEEHLALAIRVARDLGSPVVRVVLGNFEDRKSPGGIAARIRDTARVCRSQRARARDAGVKIAIENHAGDMQAHEVIALCEQAGGRSFMGVNIDPGNAVWAMEDPLAHLEVLGPWVVTSSMRDSVLWPSERGATVQWTAMGEGLVDWRAYFARFAQLCPGVPVHIETISGFDRELPFLDPEHWKLYPDMRASDLARFVALVRRGKSRPPWKATGPDVQKATEDYQRGELERSLAYCRDVLGLGRAAAARAPSAASGR